jgi:trimeric autotransporter adhesin
MLVLTVGACVVLLAASVIRGSTAAGAGRSTSPIRSTEGIVQQQGTLTIARGSEDGAGGSGTITVTPPGVSCPPTCSFLYEEGDTLTLTGNPSPGSFFYRWDHVQRRSTCAASNFEAICTVRLTGTDTEINAIFLPDPTLAVGVTGNNAAVTVSGGNTCETSQNGGDACYYPAAPGSTVTLTPSTIPGSTFLGWSVPECPDTGDCRIVVDSQLRTVVATYLPTKLSIIKSNAQNGTVRSGELPPKINCDETCSDASADYATLTEVTLTASPAATITFKGWNGVCAPAGTSPTCTVRLSGDDVAGAWFDGPEGAPNIIPPRVPVQLQVKKSGDGAGTVTSTRSRLS